MFSCRIARCKIICCFTHTGERTWREDLRGRARDHTLGNPLLPPAQNSDPPTNLTTHEAIMLQYLPIRDDFEVRINSTIPRTPKHILNFIKYIY